MIIKFRHTIFVITTALIMVSAVGALGAVNARFEQSDTIKAGIRPLYALVLGDYAEKYKDAPGFLAYARGGYQLNIADMLLLYPEFNWGFLYVAHETESDRRLLLFPFMFNIFFDAKVLNFQTKAGTFVLKPYIGLGVYINDYKSSRTASTGGDFGFQMGINLEYTHVNMKNCYIEVGIDYFLTTNFNDTLHMLAFSVGAGYAFDISKYKKGVSGDGEGLAPFINSGIKRN